MPIPSATRSCPPLPRPRVRWALPSALAAGLLVAGSAGALDAGAPVPEPTSAGAAPQSMALAPRSGGEPASRHSLHHHEVGYVCPMHPDQAGHEEGRCPICGMRLVAVEDVPASAAQGESGHGESGHGDTGDPHAHHRQLLAGAGYTRTLHAYDPPDLPLVDAQGRGSSLQRILDDDRPVLLNFIFTTCTTICPVLSATFAQVQQQLGSGAERVHMVSISIDPEHDTPERLRAYAQRFTAGPQWSFLTGELKDIVAVQRAFNAYRGSKMNHPPLTFLRAAAGGPWVRLDGIASGSDVVRELQGLVKG